MIQIDHIINNVDGLHARPIAELADIAKKTWNTDIYS